jgi:hypothetical protein
MKEKSSFYILAPDSHEPINVSIEDWAEWLRAGGREQKRVDLTKVGNYYVSTVFLGTDHNWFEQGEPILFETMIYHCSNGEFEDDQWRYCTWDEAVKGHNQIVRKMKRKEKHNDQ